MDLGIAGRKALVCASSKGLGRACAEKLAEAGCEVVVNGRSQRRRRGDGSGNPQGHRRQGDRGRRRRRQSRGPGRVVCGLPAARHSGHQQLGAAAAPLRRGQSPANARRRDRQHGGTDRADPKSPRAHGRQQVRAHRQHHLGRRADAADEPRGLLRGARRAHGVPDDGRARGRPSTTSPSTSCCRAPSTPIGCGPCSRPMRGATTRRRRRCGRNASRRFRRNASAARKSLARLARSSAPPMRALLPAITS